MFLVLTYEMMLSVYLLELLHVSLLACVIEAFLIVDLVVALLMRFYYVLYIRMFLFKATKHADHLLFELKYALRVRETLVLIILEVMILPLARSKHHGLMCTKSQRKQMILGFG